MRSALYAIRDMHTSVRCLWFYDPTYQTRGSYAYETEEETKAVEDREIDMLNRGEWVVLGCVVQRKVGCACPDCDGWHEVDACWGIVIEPDNEKLDKYARECMGVR